MKIKEKRINENKIDEKKTNEEKTKNNKIKKADFILLIVILFIGGIFCLFNMMKKPGKRVVIEIDGREQDSFYLNEDSEGLEKTYKFYDDKGENTILIKDGKVSCIEADCPDKICVKHKSIDKAGESIICLPHRFVVEVKDE